ncbi:thiamine pyrophosphate-binding protein [Sulfurimonas sp.]|nr:thiamine pyrophosphate-binding protein [Sulfurimonas sp.]
MDRVKLSDYVIEYLIALKIEHVFVIQGGAVAHLINSIEKNEDIKYITCQHEQACAMAADAYSRTSKTIGVAMATSGPGATNLITGIANAYYDSIPVLYITGNVTSFRQSANMGIRQYGFQETDIVNIVKPITKYAIALEDPNDIDYVLSKAIFEANNKRKGPVLIDIPDDFQRLEIDKEGLKKFINPVELKIEERFAFTEIHNFLKMSKRPVLIFGSGIISSNSLELARQTTYDFNIPTVFSWPLKGMFNYNDDLNFGSFGTNSLRSGNFIVQNADLIIVIGNRLDTHATGKLDEFAREAKIVVVDIDENELKKFEHFGKKIDLKYCMDCKDFLVDFNKINYTFDNNNWLEYCRGLKNKYYKDNLVSCKNISPGYFFEELSKIVSDNTVFIGDTGANLVYLFNGMKEKLGQKYISAFNNTPMGFAISASIGTALANKDKNIICCTGDGGLQMNIQELATIAYYNLPITIIVFNNRGHGMIKQTQDDWFNSKYSASSHQNGIPNLNFKDIAHSYGIDAVKIDSDKEVDSILSELKYDKPFLIELIIDENLRINPMIQFGRPLEDMNPLLEREEFIDNMIVQPLKISEV